MLGLNQALYGRHFFLNLEHKCHVRDTTIRFYQSLSISEQWKAFFLRSQRTLFTVHYCN